MFTKTTLHGHRSGEFDDVQGRSRFVPKKVITVDESWLHVYDNETKTQSSQWKRPEGPRSKEARQIRSNKKVLLFVFFDCNGVVHHEFLPQGRAVNKEYCLEVMSRLREAIRQKLKGLGKK